MSRLRLFGKQPKRRKTSVKLVQQMLRFSKQMRFYKMGYNKSAFLKMLAITSAEINTCSIRSRILQRESLE